MLKAVAAAGILSLALMGAPASLVAQTRSAVSGSELESAVLTAPAPNQAAVQRFLQNDRVATVATSMGVRATDLAAGVSRLDEATLSQLAERTRAADLGLAGGDGKVVLGTTAFLLIIIIIILLAS